MTLTEASASTAQLGYWSAQGNRRFMKVLMKSGNRPWMMLCLTDRMRVSCSPKTGWWKGGGAEEETFKWGRLMFSGHSIISDSQKGREQLSCRPLASESPLTLLIANWRSLESSRKCNINEKMENRGINRGVK